MSNYDERVNDEADEHVQMMNKGREGWDGKTRSIIKATCTMPFNTYEIKDDNNEK